MPAAALDVALVATESSADLLGAGLMRSLAQARPGGVSFRGVGGPQMDAAGLAPFFPMGDIAAIGIAAVIARLPTILRRMRETVDAIVARPPDVLVLIDAPDFTHRVAARVRRRLPNLPIVKYVSPTVWAWRPGRAKTMRRSFDLLLALLPFEPDIHRELGGPPCIYVGHPVLDRLAQLQPAPDDAQARSREPPLVLALPGSRPQELRRLGGVFGEALAMVAARRGGTLDVALPTLPHLADAVAQATISWPLRPRILLAEAEKSAAFRRARAALAASGTVTLELALARVPHVAAYRVPALEAQLLRTLMKVHPRIAVHSVILANLLAGEYAVPEFLQGRCTAAEIAPALLPLLDDTPTRTRQLDAFARIEEVVAVAGASPSARAAQAVLDLLATRPPAGGFAAAVAAAR
jgi:lipid-A-disaccharide synthase